MQHSCVSCYICNYVAILNKLEQEIMLIQAFSRTNYNFLLVISLLFCLNAFTLFAQDVVQGTVIESQTNTTIPFAQIYWVERDAVYISDSAGVFLLPKPNTTRIQLKISAPGYQVTLLNVIVAETNWQFSLQSKHVDLQEITVSGTAAQLQNQNPFHIETRKLSELTEIPAVNMGEAIARIPGVYQSSLGNGIAKPVIRGMQGMRVVSLVNGLRIEGQQWGGDHGMGMAELGIGSVEIIKGPASLLYGADALGGVIYYADVPYVASGTREIQSQTMGQLNTLGGVSRLLWRESGKKVRWMFGSSYANHADFGLPSGRFAQNSRFNELVVKGGLSFNGKKSVHQIRYTYNHTTTGIPGHTHDSLATPETFQVLEQKRYYTLPAQFFSNHYVSSDNKWYMNKHEFQVLLGYTNNSLIEYDEKVTIPSLSMHLGNKLYSFRWINKQFENWKITSGFQGMFQVNTNATNASDTLIPNSTTLDNGLYSTAQVKRENWNFQFGIRYDIRLLQTKYSFNGRPKINSKYDGWNASIGAVRSSDIVTFRSSVATGFRAPHLTELLSNGFHHGALRYEIGDLDLIPENATQLDLTIEVDKEHYVFIFNPFINRISNYIYIQPIDSSIANIPVFEYRQLDEVYFHGSDIAFHYHPHFLHNLHYEGSYSLVKATTFSDSSVSLLPQPRLQNSLKYSINLGKRLIFKQVMFHYTWMGKQNQVAFNESISNSYHLLDAAIQLEWKGKSEWVFNVGCKNLTNTRYIDHLSRLKNIQMPGPGRNLYLGINYSIKQVKIK